MNDTRPILLLVSHYVSNVVSNVKFVPPYSRSASSSSLSFATIFSAALRSEADHVFFRVGNGDLLAELGISIPCRRPKLEDDESPSLVLIKSVCLHGLGILHRITLSSVENDRREPKKGGYALYRKC